jgi:lipoate-protein ligase A
MNKVLKNKNHDKISSIKQEMSFIPPVLEIKNNILDELKKDSNQSIIESEFSVYEKKIIKKLLKEKYHNRNWNFLR